jgi:hypothetical protein
MPDPVLIAGAQIWDYSACLMDKNLQYLASML